MANIKSETFNIDCMDGMSRFSDGFFHIGICDVPYGIDVGNMAFLKEKKTKVLQKNGSRINPHTHKNYDFKDWDKQPPGQEYFNELKRVTRNQIVFGINYCNWDGVGPGRIKWDKLVPDGLSFNRYEEAYCSFTEETIELPLLWSGMQQAKSLSEPTVPQGNKKLNERRIHPCHKPVLLYLKLLIMFSEPGQNILDTHLGGGSIRIACDRFGVNFYGFEIDRGHFQDHEKRYKKYLSQKSGDLFQFNQNALGG